MEAKELIRRYNAGKRDSQRADLSYAELRWAELLEADLSHANLEGANVAPGQLSWEVTLELEGATMPDGTKQE